jgi:hypothetical protein
LLLVFVFSSVFCLFLYNDQKKKAEDNTMTKKKDRRQKTIQ